MCWSVSGGFMVISCKLSRLCYTRNSRCNIVIILIQHSSTHLVIWRSFSFLIFFFFKHKTAYEMRISDWSSDVCSSDLLGYGGHIYLFVWGYRRTPIFAAARSSAGRTPCASAAKDCHNIAVTPRAEGVTAQCAAETSMPSGRLKQIGRASCRARGCQYV